MGNAFFRFKKFLVRQERSPMKVGTDGVLLGAWGEAGEGECDILDIGTGTGVVALAAAQRNLSARVDAIEILPEAAGQATENFAASPWSERLKAIDSSLQDFYPDKKYRYIFSNPPYFIDSLKPGGGRATARHTDTLSYEELADGVARLLEEDGVFSAIFPYVESNLFIAVAASHRLYCRKRLEVRGKADKPVKRVLLLMGRERVADLPVETLVIEDERGFTDKYREITKDFYLYF